MGIIWFKGETVLLCAVTSSAWSSLARCKVFLLVVNCSEMIFKVLPSQDHPGIPHFYEILRVPAAVQALRWVRAACAPSRLTERILLISVNYTSLGKDRKLLLWAKRSKMGCNHTPGPSAESQPCSEDSMPPLCKSGRLFRPQDCKDN